MLSRRRWWILALLCAITAINFIDRQTVSVLAPLIKPIFHLSNAAYGRVVAAFQFGMLTGELPMGWVMDRWGCQLGLIAAVLWWSTATGSQAFMRSGLQLGIMRFWMGTGECGNYSGGTKTVSRIFPKGERTLALGIFNSGSVIGAVVAPPFIVYLAQRYGFRAAFLAPALLGVVWAFLWWLTYRGPSEVTAQDAMQTVPLASLFSQSSTWAVMLCRFFVGPVIQFYWYWLPSYLYSVRHLSLIRVGGLSWIPFFLGGAGGVAGGMAAGWLHKRGTSTYNVRRSTMLGSSMFCFASFLVPFCPSMPISLLIISIAIFGHNFLSANMYGAITDLFPENAVGRATGLSGVAGSLSGLLFPLLTGVLVDRSSYTPVFILAAAMPLMGTISLFLLAQRDRFNAPHQTPECMKYPK
ncbi:MFS transporter [Edaphobacter bradus]|uniref:MFS transporter n=1 Tax=Edaphobacter bradus TaxID=2259016 RepID=UPI0021E04685|nr:MFS transporter [Edaphobacter bradus]